MSNINDTQLGNSANWVGSNISAGCFTLPSANELTGMVDNLEVFNNFDQQEPLDMLACRNLSNFDSAVSFGLFSVCSGVFDACHGTLVVARTQLSHRCLTVPLLIAGDCRPIKHIFLVSVGAKPVPSR